MARKYIVISENFEKAVRETAATLAAGGVAVFPTETVYGVGVASGNAEALARLRRLKSRGGEKPFQYLASDMSMAKELGAEFSARADRLARAFWPGPMTMVVPDGTAGGGTLGIRIPDSEFVLALCAALGGPIVSSSANPAGEQPPSTARAADAFGDEVDLLADGGAIVGGIPSTVVRCVGGEVEILRRGGVEERAIRDAWAE